MTSTIDAAKQSVTLAMRLILTCVLVLLALPVWAGEAKPEYKAIPELDALRLEKSEAVYQAVQADIRALQERGERIKEQVLRYIQDLQRALDCVNCQLDLPNRRFIKPPKPDMKQEGSDGNP